VTIDYSGLPLAKPEPRKRVKARNKRHAAKVVQDVRAQVAARDGYCRLHWLHDGTRRALARIFGACSGPSEWCHFGKHKRARTRGKPPEERHHTQGSLMLCVFHHDAYDDGKMTIEALTDRECDGLLKFAKDGVEYLEVA
jgi:hypothetical protein